MKKELRCGRFHIPDDVGFVSGLAWHVDQQFFIASSRPEWMGGSASERSKRAPGEA